MPAMSAALKGFLWLWLPMLALLLAGVWRAWSTGQADPWDWGIAAAILLAGAGLLLARCGPLALAWVAVGAAGPALIFCALAAAQTPPAGASLGLVAIALLAVFGGAWLRQPPPVGFRPVPVRMKGGWPGRGIGAFLLALSALLIWRGPAQPIAAAPDRPKLAVLTALPLFWVEPGQAGNGPRDAPIVTVLRTRFAVEPLDDPLQLASSGARALLVAQPRALTPEQLVAIDDWVRAGGRALILADPLLRWPSTLPLGDRRRPPSASLLGPLLAHWGFAPGLLVDQESRHFTADGHLLTLSGAWMFDGAAMQRKRLGRGEALLLGDADLIDDRLWLADPARPLDPRGWVADTPALVADWLGAPISGERRWMRTPHDVIAGLRWAILVGTGWAMLGTMLLRRNFAHGRSEQKVKIT